MILSSEQQKLFHELMESDVPAHLHLQKHSVLQTAYSEKVQLPVVSAERIPRSCRMVLKVLSAGSHKPDRHS